MIPASYAKDIRSGGMRFKRFLRELIKCRVKFCLEKDGSIAVGKRKFDYWGPIEVLAVKRGFRINGAWSGWERTWHCAAYIDLELDTAISIIVACYGAKEKGERAQRYRKLLIKYLHIQE